MWKRKTTCTMEVKKNDTFVVVVTGCLTSDTHAFGVSTLSGSALRLSKSTTALLRMRAKSRTTAHFVRGHLIRADTNCTRRSNSLPKAKASYICLALLPHELQELQKLCALNERIASEDKSAAMTGRTHLAVFEGTPSAYQCLLAGQPTQPYV